MSTTNGRVMTVEEERAREEGDFDYTYLQS